MPRDATETRRKLLDAAALSFAEHGVRNASMVEITRRAGQRNTGALHYHFGGREGVLCAVLAEYADFLHRREGELLEAAVGSGDDGLEPVVEAVVRPAAELAEQDWRGRCFLVVLADVIEQDPATFGPEVNDVLDRTGGDAVYRELRRRMPAMAKRVQAERLALMTMVLLRAVADRARTTDKGGDVPRGAGPRPGRRHLPYEAFVQNLVAMLAAALAAPDRVSTGRTRRRR